MRMARNRDRILAAVARKVLGKVLAPQEAGPSMAARTGYASEGGDPLMQEPQCLRQRATATSLPSGCRRIGLCGTLESARKGLVT